MLIDKEINRLLQELSHAEQAQIYLNGFAVSVHMLECGSRLTLSTPVYCGGNYIPNSVRESLRKKAPFDRLDIQTFLEIDEEDFSIMLIYQGECAPSGYGGIVDLLEDFSWLAEKWRDYLDEQDKNDLIYVTKKL
ncbi:hypothetical protein [Waddlia chondrophila]|nr:hypothetical protein [Waddlia chondrophila]